MKNGLVFGGLALLSLSLLPAQTVELAKMEVIASPIVDDTRLDDHASRTVIVGAEQLEALNAQDIASALRRTPSVAITRYNGSCPHPNNNLIFN